MPYIDTSGEGVGADQNSKRPTKKELEELWDWDVGLYGPRFPHLIRDLLNSGLLSEIIQRYSPSKRARWTESELYLVLIAYCAMQLGCILPCGFVTKLKTNYRRVGLMDEGERQMRQACDEYVDGKPYEFASVGLIETMMMSSEGINDRPKPQAPGLQPINSGEPTTDEPAPKRPKTESEAVHPPIVEFEFWFPPDKCANCGAAEGYCEPQLKRCKGCKDTLYCFEGCQNWHWFRHRRHCQEVQEQNKQSEAGTSGQKEAV